MSKFDLRKYLTEGRLRLLKEEDNLNLVKKMQDLDDIKDAESASVWIKDQLDEYMKNNFAHYGSGGQLESKLKKLLKLVTTKFRIPEDSFKVEYKEVMSSGQDSMGDDDKIFIDGYIKLNGQYILIYSSDEDGYGFVGDISETKLLKTLKAELEKK